jgi:hypothetical protein
MLSADAEYNHVSDITKYKSDLIHGAFDQFIKVFTAVVGGSIWLSRQKDLTKSDHMNFRTLSDVIVAILVIYTAISVIDDFRSWWGYRSRLTIIGKQSEINLKIGPPVLITSAIKPMVMVVTVFVALYFFWQFNPF